MVTPPKPYAAGATSTKPSIYTYIFSFSSPSRAFSAIETAWLGTTSVTTLVVINGAYKQAI